MPSLPPEMKILTVLNKISGKKDIKDIELFPQCTISPENKSLPDISFPWL